MEEIPFWKRKKLEELNQEEWESLCDGCARCCLHKLQDEDTGEVFTTNVVCRLLDLYTCQCTNYPARSRLVKTCLTLTPDMAKNLSWLPSTCAYRRLANGLDLEWWHPLISGDPNIVHELGISVRNMAISEVNVDMDLLDEYIIND